MQLDSWARTLLSASATKPSHTHHVMTLLAFARYCCDDSATDHVRNPSRLPSDFSPKLRDKIRNGKLGSRLLSPPPPPHTHTHTYCIARNFQGGKLLRERTFANWWKIRFLREKLLWIAHLCCQRMPHPQIKTFANSHKTLSKSFLP